MMCSRACWDSRLSGLCTVWNDIQLRGFLYSFTCLKMALDQRVKAHGVCGQACFYFAARWGVVAWTFSQCTSWDGVPGYWESCRDYMGELVLDVAGNRAPCC